MPQRAYKKQEILSLLHECFDYIDECMEKGIYPSLRRFLRQKGKSIDLFNKHCHKWQETRQVYTELHEYLAEAKLFVGLHARKVKATHLITLDLMNNHGWRERKEEQQHQYRHDIEKLREKLKEDE